MTFFLLLALVFGAFGFLAWKNLPLATLLVLPLLPTYLVRFTVGPIPMTMLEGFLLIVLGVFVFQNRKVAFFLPRSPLGYAVLFVLVLSFFAVGIAPDHLAALGIWKAYYVEPLAYGVLFHFVLHKHPDRDVCATGLRWLSLSGAVLGGLAVLQMLTGVGIPDAWSVEGRATSVFDYPNAVGLFLAPIVSATIVSLAFRWSQLRQSRRVFDGALIALMLAGIVAAKTEAAFIAVPAALLLVALMTPALTKKTQAAMISATLLLSVLLAAFVPNVVTKLMLYDASGQVRRSQWSETLTMLADHPFFGVGLSGYPDALVPYHVATDYEIFQYPHNIFLNVWSELGLLGLLGFIVALVLVGWFAWKHRDNAAVLISFAALLTLCIHGLVDVPFFKNDLAVLTVFFGVMFLVEIRERKRIT